MIKTFLNEYSINNKFVEHHIKSFDDFMIRRLQQIVTEIGEIEIELPTQENLKIKLGQVKIEAPIIKESDGSIREILPIEARMRNLTYASSLFIEMTPVFEEVEQEPIFVNVGKFPIMVKSDLCKLSKMSKEELIEVGEDPEDTGGYFIINGIERVLVLSEEIANNRLILQKKDDGTISARIDSKNKGYTQRHTFERDDTGTIGVRFANLRNKPVPLVTLIKSLGLNTDKDIINALGKNASEDIILNLYTTNETTQEEAINYIGKQLGVRKIEKITERVENILDNYLLPHLGQSPATRLSKAKYLAKVMKKIDMLYKDEIKDDIDHYSFKRLRLAGDLLEEILRSIILGRWGLVARLQYNYQKMIKRGRRLPSLQSIIITDVLTKQIMRSMAVGSFKEQTGVSQRLERNNFTSALDHMRNIVSPLSASQSHFDARELHATHWGRVCLVRTPEGQNIGLRKFLALGAEVISSENKEDVNKIKDFVINELNIKG
jgi:DNA-directed RNA polymerase beta subunit